MQEVFNGFFNAVADNIGQNPNDIVNYQNEDDLDGYVAEDMNPVIVLTKGEHFIVFLIFSRYQPRMSKHA